MRESLLRWSTARGPGASYRNKILALSGLGAAIPLVVAAASGAGPLPLAVGAAFTVVSLACLWHVIQPVCAAAVELRGCVDSDNSEVASRTGEGARLLEDAKWVTSQLAALRDRLRNRHPVSKLPTREPFLAAVAEEMARGPHMSVLGVIRFNDYDRLAAFEQGSADDALSEIAARLQTATAVDRPLAHIDRDAFALWFSDVADPGAAADELQAIAYVLAQEMNVGEVKLTPDVGLAAAIHPDDGPEPLTLLTRAIAALPPKSSHSSNGRVTFFSTESSTAARRRFSLEQNLRQAISQDQLLLHFQPVVDVAAGAVVGAEALLRWRHPDRGLVSPAEFIPVLEEAGMMDEVGLWVLNTACRQARSWQDQGLPGLKMAVNLSARQFHDPKLNNSIIGALKHYGLAPAQLELELTETATMEDTVLTKQLFGELRDLGVSVAIDDFGTGYSSLSYPKNLPFSKLKIDREFVTEVHQRRDSHAICAALVELARGLEIQILAEGVETQNEANALRHLGCSMFQGYFFARPLASEDFVRTVTDPTWLSAISAAAPASLNLKRRLSA